MFQKVNKPPLNLNFDIQPISSEVKVVNSESESVNWKGREVKKSKSCFVTAFLKWVLKILKSITVGTVNLFRRKAKPVDPKKPEPSGTNKPGGSKETTPNNSKIEVGAPKKDLKAGEDSTINKDSKEELVDSSQSPNVDTGADSDTDEFKPHFSNSGTVHYGPATDEEPEMRTAGGNVVIPPRKNDRKEPEAVKELKSLFTPTTSPTHSNVQTPSTPSSDEPVGDPVPADDKANDDGVPEFEKILRSIHDQTVTLDSCQPMGPKTLREKLKESKTERTESVRELGKFDTTKINGKLKELADAKNHAEAANFDCLVQEEEKKQADAQVEAKAEEEIAKTASVFDGIKLQSPTKLLHLTRHRATKKAHSPKPAETNTDLSQSDSSLVELKRMQEAQKSTPTNPMAKSAGFNLAELKAAQAKAAQARAANAK